MITGELKNKIDALWDIFAAGGLVNPLEVIEQITYLMFIHDLDDSDNIRAKESAMLGLPYQSIFVEEVKIGERTIDGSQLKWSVFHDFPADRMYSVMQEWVFPFIKTLHSDKNSAYSKYMDDAIFKLPTPLVLSKVVDSLDEIYKMMSEIQATDVRGDVYEYLLSKIAQSGRNGQFRTPRHIIRMMVEMMDPSSSEMICDPACGTSGFLVAAGEYLKEWLTKRDNTQSVIPSRKLSYMVASVCVLLIVCNLYGLYTRQLVLNLFLTLALLFVLWFLMKKEQGVDITYWNKLFQAGCYLLLLGLFFEAYQGGIRKDDSTYSYYFVTSGLAFIALIAFSIFCDVYRCNKLARPLEMAGQNPMIAYVAPQLVVNPIIGLLGANSLLELFNQNAFLGFLRGVLITSLAIIVAVICTRLKYFWRT